MTRLCLLLVTVLVFSPACCRSFLIRPHLVQRGRSMILSNVHSGMEDVAGDGGFFRFEEMKKIDQRLKSLEEVSSEFLMDFYDHDLYSFSIRPGSASKISITSTCYSLQSILMSPDPFVFLTKSKEKVDVESILSALLNSPWKEDDIYQVSLILLTLLRANPNTKSKLFHSDNTVVVEKVSKLISLALTARPKRRHGGNQLFSDYLSYLCCSIYASLNDSTTRGKDGQLIFGSIPAESIPEGAASDLSLALVRCREISFNELCKFSTQS